MSYSERRHTPRFPLHSQVSLLLRGSWQQGDLIDISLGGALVTLDPQCDVVAQGKPCGLHVLHQNGNSIAKFHGLVVHCEENLLGIKFIGVGQKNLLALHDLLDLNLASVQLLDRDVPALLKANMGCRT